MAEWPNWTPTADIHKRIEGLPASVPGGVDNPLGARALYLYQGNRDTLFRIHGTNQPEYIGASISSGCIRMTNEDVIDLYSRVKQGTIVVVLDPKQATRRSIPRWRCRAAATARWRNSRPTPRSSRSIKSAGFAGAFSLRGFVACARLGLAGFRIGFRSAALAGSRLAGIRLVGLRLGVSDLAATSRGGASSGRSAGNSGAICGSGSHTFHWQIR